MAFIRTKQVEGREYRQLVENYREDGKHRQRVLAHLGKHETLEEAIEALQNRLERLEPQRDEQHTEAEEYRQGILRHFSAPLEKHHGGSIPTWEAVWIKGGRLPYYLSHHLSGGEAEYRRDFAEATTFRSHSGYEVFESWVRWAERHQEKAQALQTKIDRLHHRLEKLRAVVTRLEADGATAPSNSHHTS